MLARTVRAFYLEVIHLVHRFGIAQDVVSAAAHVTAKQVTELASVFAHIQYHLRRAEDVTGIAKGHRQPVPGRKRPIVIDGDKLAHGFFGIGRAIERFDWRQAAFGALFGNERRVVALDLGRIFQHDAGQVTRGKGAVDVSFETLPAQVRQIAAVIDVRVTQHHRIDFARVEGKLAVTFNGFIAVPLVETALQQDFSAIELQEVHRTGGGTGGAVKVHSHLS